MGDLEYGTCDTCNQEKPVLRKYYKYAIACDCCGGGKHFEIVRYCQDCTPRPPKRAKVMLKSLSEMQEQGSRYVAGRIGLSGEQYFIIMDGDWMPADKVINLLKQRDQLAADNKELQNRVKELEGQLEEKTQALQGVVDRHTYGDVYDRKSLKGKL